MKSNYNNRELELKEWLSEIFAGNIDSFQPASEDASFRRYFRVVNNRTSYIAMDAPVDENRNIADFVRIAVRLQHAGLNVPVVFEQDLGKGFLLLSDLGNTTYLDILSGETCNELYQDAINSLIKLQKAGLSEPDFLPAYSNDLLRSEMELFRQWYLPLYLNVTPSEYENSMISEAFDYLISVAQSQPRSWVHLDYHSRNLMYVKNHNPGILDFQDAVYGPVTYDLVSLLRDCYISWSPNQTTQWIQSYLKKARNSGIVVGDSEKQFVKWFDLMGIQRHLKVLGIFSRLCYRDNKKWFLKDLPLVLNYMLSVSAKYPRLKELNAYTLKAASK